MSPALRVAVLAVACLSPLAAGCNDKALQTNAAAGDAGRHLTGQLSPEQASKVLAKVGDRTITLGEFVAAIEHMDQFDRLRYQSPEKRKELLRELVNVQLLADEAVAKGYDKDPLTQQEIRSILRTAMMEEAHQGAPTPNAISEADVTAYYNAHKNEYRDPERRRVSVIVLPNEAKAAPVLQEAKKANSAAKWGELVRAKSLDPAAKANVPLDLAGDYGMVAPAGEASTEATKVPDAVRDAAFEIPQVGQVYDKLVKPPGDTRVFIVRLTQKTDAHERSLAEADRSIRVKLVQEKVREREDALLARLRSEYPVQIDDAVLAQVHVDLQSGPHQMVGEAGAPPPPPGGASPGAPH